MRKKEMKDRFDDLAVAIQRIEAALVVRDPGNARSADAFDGLRKQVAMAVRSRRTHVSHMLTLADDLQKGATLETISSRVRDFLNELSVARSEDTELDGAFQIEGDGDVVEVQEPAWVDVMEDGTRLVLKQGRATRKNGEQA